MKHRLGETDVSRETRVRLERYAELLLRWNQKINLISQHSVGDVWSRHIDDALQLIRYIPAHATTAVDLGSGGGIPGLVLAIATSCHFHLIESDRRKAAFLQEAASATHASVTVHPQRLENVVIDRQPLLTCRALAPVSRLLPALARFLSNDGVALLLKGSNADQELTDASAEWHMKVTRHRSVTDPSGVILSLSEVRPA